MPRSPGSIRFAPGDPPDPTVTVRPMTDDEIRRYGPPARVPAPTPEPSQPAPAEPAPPAKADPASRDGAAPAPASPPAPVHPTPHDAPVRAQALARLAAGEPIHAVAQALGVPPARIRAWNAQRHRRPASPPGAPRPRRRAGPDAETALRHWIAWARHRWSRNPHGVALHRPFLLAACARYGPHVHDAALADAAFWLQWFLDRWTPERVADDWEAVQAEISQCLDCLDFCLGPSPSPNP